MTPGLTSIIVPSYNHAAFLPEAIDSALAQTAPCEVIVVDDGSTDDTAAVLERYADRLRAITQEHAGPCVARNAGLEAARGEFVMFLDADDLIAPTKVAEQLEAFTPEIGWVLCDVRIEDDVKGRAINASEQYGYDRKELGGWIQKELIAGPFIPVMSPLVRRSVLSDTMRFEDGKVPEDWHFWVAVAGVARVRYVPRVLATYRHRRTGRSRLPKAARRVMPTLQAPLRLNLGCGTPNTRSWHPMPGLVNLDKSLGWRFEDGLGDFVDHSVAGITVSHALMYAPLEAWPFIFNEFTRVLAEDGVIRITEDETADPRSSRVGGWQGSEPAVTLTTPALVKHHLARAGLVAHDVTKETTHYRDHSLRQAQHGDPPDVFFVEGVKLRGTLFAPHNDDEALFAAFTILRYRPRVVVCFGSTGDYGDPLVREAETRDAMTVLGAGDVEQWGVRTRQELERAMQAFDDRVHPVRVWAPDPETSHPDHQTVFEAAAHVFRGRLTTYHTYVDGAKVRSDRLVAFEPAWVEQKLRALARYRSQIHHARAHHFFTMDLLEYEGLDR